MVPPATHLPLHVNSVNFTDRISGTHELNRNVRDPTLYRLDNSDGKMKCFAMCSFVHAKTMCINARPVSGTVTLPEKYSKNRMEEQQTPNGLANQ